MDTFRDYDGTAMSTSTKSRTGRIDGCAVTKRDKAAAAFGDIDNSQGPFSRGFIFARSPMPLTYARRTSCAR